MTSDRYVCLGLARARAPWFAEVSRWAVSGSLAMDFLKAVSEGEVRARLRSGRPFSALLVDGDLPGVDRDLLETAAEHGCAPIVVTDHERDWLSAGASAVLPTEFSSLELDAVLSEVAQPIDRVDELLETDEVRRPSGGFRARTIAVTGSGGAGRSVIAMALAQGFAGTVEHADSTVLADLSLHADQAILHDTGDVIPGIVELTEAHRTGAPSPDDVRSLTFEIVARRYRLLLGLRRHRDWTVLRPRALNAGLDSLRQAFTLVVADVDADFEGESSTGSADIEDRNRLSRAMADLADIVVVVGAPGLVGSHAMARVVRDCLAAGVPSQRIVPVVNRAPRSRRARAELVKTHVALLASSNPTERVLSPVLVPERRELEASLRDAAGIPKAIETPIFDAVAERLDVVPERVAAAAEPTLVAAGSLGQWHEDSA